MYLATPRFLLGLAGALIPVLIYLLTRQRVKQVAFSTLRFFAGAATVMVRRKKTLEMLLLALRVIACILLAVAFARPFFADKDPALAGLMQAPAVRIVVADLSGSMARGDLTTQLREAGREALKDLPRDAVAALVGFDKAPRVISAPTRDVDTVRDAVAKLAAGEGGTDISAALRKASDLLRQVDAPVREIICITDAHRSGWESFRGDWLLEPGVKLTVRALSSEQDGGLAIAATDYPQSVVAGVEPQTLSVRLCSASAVDAKDIPVTLGIEGKVVESVSVTVPAHGTASARFRHRFTAPGDNLGVVAVSGGDVPVRRFHFNTRVIPRIPILIITPHAGDPKSDGGTFFLKAALTPSPDSPFAAELVNPTAVTADSIRAASVIILADVSSLSAEIVAALSDRVSSGGGLCFIPGSQTKPDAFNAAFAGLAPAKLRRIIAASTGHQASAKAVIGKIEYDHPAFELFQRPHHGDFSALAFERCWEVSDSQLCRVPVRFDDGRPMLLENSHGGGIVMLMASPPDLTWGNLPLRAIFLPYVHQLMRHMALRTERPTALFAGQTLPRPAAGQSILDPDNKPLPAESELVAVRDGFYTLVDEQAKPLFRYAVNQDPSEVDSDKVDPKEIVAALLSDEVQVVQPAGNRGPDDPSLGPRRELWPALLAALALLLFAELWVANRTTEQ